MKHISTKLLTTSFPSAAILLASLATLSIACDQNADRSAKSSMTTAAIGQTFASADAASDALIVALRNNDAAALTKIVGPDGADLVTSGDEVVDSTRREKFLAAYDAAHELEKNAPGDSADSYTLLVGTQRWPLPIPIVLDDATKRWYFDIDAGQEELLNRRIGQNELDTIQTVEAVVDAQKEYARLDPNRDGVPEYARKFISDPATRNGLYWITAPDESPSPLGSLVANAVDEGYTAKAEPQPYHGYIYRMVLSQGPNAPGGKMDYVINGKLLAGFAVVAYPANYGNSGIMTFIVAHDGQVFQKDLGPDTAKIARKLDTYNPSPDWKKVEAVITTN